MRRTDLRLAYKDEGSFYVRKLWTDRRVSIWNVATRRPLFYIFLFFSFDLFVPSSCALFLLCHVQIQATHTCGLRVGFFLFLPPRSLSLTHSLSLCGLHSGAPWKAILLRERETQQVSDLFKALPTEPCSVHRVILPLHMLAIWRNNCNVSPSPPE